MWDPSGRLTMFPLFENSAETDDIASPATTPARTQETKGETKTLIFQTKPQHPSPRKQSAR